MGFELLAPFAKWGAVLIGGAGLLWAIWYQLREGIRADVKFKNEVARSEALESLSVRNSSIRETRAGRRARLERIVREATED